MHRRANDRSSEATLLLRHLWCCGCIYTVGQRRGTRHRPHRPSQYRVRQARGGHCQRRGHCRFSGQYERKPAYRATLTGTEGQLSRNTQHDNGTQYLADDFQREIEFLGIESSPSFVRAPEGNGCAERIIRTLKEQLLWVRNFDTIEELRQALQEWRTLYNEQCMVERHDHRSPSQVRREHHAASLPMAA